MSPATKGQITKARKIEDSRARFNAVRAVFAKSMPAEQAKHAARKALVTSK